MRYIHLEAPVDIQGECQVSSGEKHLELMARLGLQKPIKAEPGETVTVVRQRGGSSGKTEKVQPRDGKKNQVNEASWVF